MLSERYTASMYKNHLEIFFHYLCTNGDIEAGCPTIRNKASSVLQRIKQQHDGDNWSLKVGPWILPINENDDIFNVRKACLLIYGLIEARDSELDKSSFSVGIVLNPPREDNEMTCCDKLNKDQYRVARLFRFEFEEGNIETSKPASHMHYGGKLPSYLSLPYHNCLEDWIEKPRIPIPPLDFVLLFEIFLRQFNLGIKKKLFKESFWRKCIRKSERMLLTKYYTNVHICLSEDGEGTLLDSLCS